MKHFLSWDDTDDTIEVTQGDGWREPHSGEFSRLGALLLTTATPRWLDWIVVVAVLVAAVVMGRGGGA